MVSSAGGPSEFASVAPPIEKSPVQRIMDRAVAGPVHTIARDIARASEIYTNAIAAQLPPEDAINLGVQAVNAFYDGDYERSLSSYPWYEYSNEGMGKNIVTLHHTGKVA